jgi:hypothetical protein
VEQKMEKYMEISSHRLFKALSRNSTGENEENNENIQSKYWLILTFVRRSICKNCEISNITGR